MILSHFFARKLRLTRRHSHAALSGDSCVQRGWEEMICKYIHIYRYVCLRLDGDEKTMPLPISEERKAITG
jgi:hypothetical protein